jgi:hypothetical protein
MYVVKAIAVVAAMVAASAAAQDVPAGGVLGSADDGSVYELTRRAEREEYLYRTFADRDTALAKWCDSGFAPIELCARRRVAQGKGGGEAGAPGAALLAPPSPAPAPVAAPAPAPAPVATVAAAPAPVDPYPREISVWDKRVTAWLVYPDGSEVRKAKIGDKIADGSEIVGISVTDGVRVKRRNGETETLRTRVPAPRITITPLQPPGQNLVPPAPAVPALPTTSLRDNPPNSRR